MSPLIRRRTFLQRTAAAVASSLLPRVAFAAESRPILGQGDFRYRVVPEWGVLGEGTPVNNCHGLVRDREGHVLLFTDEVRNNVIIYDKAGRLVNKWGHSFPGAHGMSIQSEGSREVLFLTDLQTHRVTKTTLDGEVLQEWRWPEATGKYSKEEDYKPSWTLHLPDGGFYVLDGYGRDYIVRYKPDGSFQEILGGAEGGIVHWGPHGGMVDARDAAAPTLLIAMSDQQYILRLSLEGKVLARIDLPGGNPRQIRLHKNHFFCAHLADNWPKDRESRGFISVLDSELRVISNIGGSPPVYDAAGRLSPMAHQEDIFRHPHDLLVDADESLYVAQFASAKTYPIKLERV